MHVDSESVSAGCVLAQDELEDYTKTLCADKRNEELFRLQTGKTHCRDVVQCTDSVRGLLLIVLYYYDFMVRWIILTNSQYLFLSGSASHPVSPWSCLRRGEAKLQLATVRRQLRQENADEESSAEDQQLGGAVRQRRARLRGTIHRCLRSERSLLRRHTGL